MDAATLTVVGLQVATLGLAWSMFTRLSARIDRLDAKLDAKFDGLTTRIDGINARLDSHVGSRH